MLDTQCLCERFAPAAFNNESTMAETRHIGPFVVSLYGVSRGDGEKVTIVRDFLL